MPMNMVIIKKRKELGLTQEQVAGYLNVSIPAVSKWESGSTNPDVSLLPSLARLLKIDLNTLLCFREDMSQQEIGEFCKEITNILQTKGIAEGFKTAGQKIHEYPHNETLLHYLTLQLDGFLVLSGLSSDEMCQYDDILCKWYRHLAKSNDSKISNSANFMMVSRFIRKGDYNKAQEVLDIMPDKEDIISSMADKLMLQLVIYQHQGKTEKVAKELQNALLMALNKVQILLFKMVDAELEAGEIQAAKSIADKTKQMTELFGLWKYNSYAASWQIAAAEKNEEECICILRKMLATMLTPWDMGSSLLFHRIARTSDPAQMLQTILSAMERDSEYGFLQSRDDFKELIAEYKALTRLCRQEGGA